MAPIAPAWRNPCCWVRSSRKATELAELDRTEEVRKEGRSAVLRRAVAEYLHKKRPQHGEAVPGRHLGLDELWIDRVIVGSGHRRNPGSVPCRVPDLLDVGRIGPESPVTLEITSLRDVESDIVEYIVSPDSTAAGKLVRELELPSRS